jgi:Glycosyltransferase family 87
VPGGVAVPMITRVAAVAAIAFFLLTAFRSGWRRAETDFPNYYTGAVSVRKGLPLRNYYDWTWFQRQMNYDGIERQLGSYQPQTPLTALPFVGLSWLAPQRAKQVWLLIDLVFLGATVWILKRITGFRVEQVVLLSFVGFGSLYTNFLNGQYYIFLLFLLTLTFYFLDRGKSAVSGLISGMTFSLRPDSGPLLFYFAVKRNWRAAAGFAVSVAAAVGLAVALFGWSDVAFYVTQILPRNLGGEIVDPYSSQAGTIGALLGRLLVLEPELNPNPVWNAPHVFFFLRPFVILLILGMTLLGLASIATKCERRDFSWFLIATSLLSPLTASYTFIVLLLPISLLLIDAHVRERLFLVASFFALCIPLRAGWTWAFPKLWVLLALYCFVGRRYLRAIGPELAIGLVAGCALLAGVRAHWRAVSFAAEPGQTWERVAAEKGAIFSSSPAVSRAGLFYQSIGDDRYVLRWLHNGKIEKLKLEGFAFRPVAPSPDGPIYFELVANGRSATMQFDPSTRRVVPAVSPDLHTSEGPVVSPDGRWIAYETAGSPKHVAVRGLANGKEQTLTGGNCNSWAPAWELDSKAVIFASDCGRGVGLPSLYRARITEK